VLRTGRSAAIACHPSAVTSCPHCDAPLKPAARYCLACDRPVGEETSALSVGEAVAVSVGRPLVAVAAVAATVVVLGALVWGYVAFLHHGNGAAEAQARGDVRRGTTLLVSAEGGQPSACLRSAGVLAGPAADVVAKCQAIVDHDPGAHVASIQVDRLRLQGTTGSVRVRASIRDRTGTHALDRVVDLVHAGRAWRMSWDGRPEI
jgi:hypothetical protein